MSSERYDEMKRTYDKAMALEPAHNRLSAVVLITKEFNVTLNQATALVDCWESGLSWQDAPDYLVNSFEPRSKW